jgi:asparaginyl-tRNA synthetase
MKEDPEDPTYTCSVDMLAPEGYGEVIGGGQREESVEVLLRKIAEHGLDPKVFEWYLDLRRYGSVPHAGFGLGIERLTSWVCGAEHVRECIPFPRMLYRLTP